MEIKYTAIVIGVGGEILGRKHEFDPFHDDTILIEKSGVIEKIIAYSKVNGKPRKEYCMNADLAITADDVLKVPKIELEQ